MNPKQVLTDKDDFALVFCWRAPCGCPMASEFKHFLSADGRQTPVVNAGEHAQRMLPQLLVNAGRMDRNSELAAHDCPQAKAKAP